jgi:Icc-related predicted phosphoesterase
VRPVSGGPSLRILACADLHGWSERVALVRELAAAHAPDVVVIAGDLTNVDEGMEALTLLDTLAVPVLAVPGNMDGPGAVGTLAERGRLAGPEPHVVGGFSFGGPNVRCPCDVLVTHVPPHGTLDTVSGGHHIGSRRVLELVERLAPRVVVCGHVHESPGVARLGAATVVNCSMGAGRAAGALIELSASHVAVRLL